MPLRADLHLRREAFELQAELVVPSVGVTALFGPSGSGKSTLLRCLAGLERDARGTIRFGEEIWQDSGAGRFVPAHRRSVGYVFQDADLFSHLDVDANLAYAEKRGGRSGRRGVDRDDAIRWLGIEGLLRRDPASLSGGERQRVAIARALLARPRLLLLDEPVSSLDEVSRREILPYLEALPGRLSIPVIYVSHTLSEVLRLADRMAWISEGRVVRSGTPAEVVRDAGFAAWQGDEAGVVIEADVVAFDARHRLTRLEGPWGSVRAPGEWGGEGRPVRLRIQARDVSLALDAESRSSILNEFEMRVAGMREGEGGQVLVELVREGTDAILLARVTSLSAETLSLQPGLRVFARVKSVAVVD